MRLWWVFIRILCKIQTAMLNTLSNQPIVGHTAFPNAALMMMTEKEKSTSAAFVSNTK